MTSDHWAKLAAGGQGDNPQEGCARKEGLHGVHGFARVPSKLPSPTADMGRVEGWFSTRFRADFALQMDASSQKMGSAICASHERMKKVGRWGPISVHPTKLCAAVDAPAFGGGVGGFGLRLAVTLGGHPIAVDPAAHQEGLHRLGTRLTQGPSCPAPLRCRRCGRQCPNAVLADVPSGWPKRAG